MNRRLVIAALMVSAFALLGCGSSCAIQGAQSLFAVGVPGNASTCPAQLDGALTVADDHHATLALGGLPVGTCDPNLQTFDNGCRVDMGCVLGSGGQTLHAGAEYLPDETVIHDEGLVSTLAISDGGDGTCFYRWTVTR